MSLKSILRSRRPLPLLEPADGYALWAPSYAPHAHNALMRAEEDAVTCVLAGIRFTRALDVGTGSGRYLARLRARAGVVGLDLSREMLACNRAGAPLVCADAVRLPCRDGVFDLVLSSLTIGHLPRLHPFVAECARVLAPGGHLVLSDVHPTWEHAGWSRTFTAADGRLFAIRQHWHRIDDVRVALDAHGFRVESIDEPRLGDASSREVAAWRRRWGNPPVAVVTHAVRR